MKPPYDNFSEISYIKKFISVLNDDTFRDFFSSTSSREEISRTFQAKISTLNKEGRTYEARKKYYKRQMFEGLNAVDTYEKHNKKRNIKNINEKMTDSFDQHKTKTVIHFNGLESASIKSFAVKKKNEIKITSRLISGKLLMFAKLSFESFIYD